MFSLPLFISGPEIIVILLIVVMLFGADKIPEIARTLGKGIREVKDATNQIKREINETAEKPELNIHKEISKDINKEVKQVKDEVEEFTRPIKRNF